MHALIWLASLLRLDPVPASLAGARLAGFPGLASELLDICEVETGCERVGLHRDARPDIPRVRGRVFWRAARARGWVSDCPAHQLGGGRRWGVRGTHGRPSLKGTGPRSLNRDDAAVAERDNRRVMKGGR